MAGNAEIVVDNRRIEVGRGVFGVTRRQLQAMTDYMKQFRGTEKFKRKLANFTRREISQNFADEVDADGSPWPELSEMTLRWRKQNRYPSGPPLQASGDLHRAVTGRGLRVTFSREGVKIRPAQLDHDTLKKIAIHNEPVGHKTKNPPPWVGYGGTIPGPIPGRQFFYLREDAIDFIVSLIMEDMQESVTATVEGKTLGGAMLNMAVANGSPSRRKP